MGVAMTWDDKQRRCPYGWPTGRGCGLRSNAGSRSALHPRNRRGWSSSQENRLTCDSEALRDKLC